MTKIMDVDFSHQVTNPLFDEDSNATNPFFDGFIDKPLESSVASPFDPFLQNVDSNIPSSNVYFDEFSSNFGSANAMSKAPDQFDDSASASKLMDPFKSGTNPFGSNFETDNSFSMSSASPPLSSPVFNGANNSSSSNTGGVGIKPDEKEPFASFNENDMFQTSPFGGIEDGLRQLELENNSNNVSEKRRIEFKIEPNLDLFTPKQMNDSSFVVDSPSQFDVMLASPSMSETPSLSTSSSFLKSSTMTVNTALTGLSTGPHSTTSSVMGTNKSKTTNSGSGSIIMGGLSSDNPVEDLDKQLSKFNEDQKDVENRTQMFLAKVNARITNNISNNFGSGIYSMKTTSEAEVGNGDGGDEDFKQVPEDNVERLRNIRDMFENTNNDEDLVLQKVEKLQPSDKIKDRFKNGGSDLNSEETPTTTTTNQDSNLNGQDSPNCSTSEIEFDDLETVNLQAATTVPPVHDDDDDHLQQQQKGAYSLTAQQIISSMDTSNFILQEQKQERSINGNDDLLVTMVTSGSNNDDLMTASPPINELESKSNGLLSVNGINLVSSSSSSVTSSMSSSMEPAPGNNNSSKNLLIEDEMNNNIEQRSPLPVVAESALASSNNLIDIGDFETVNDSQQQQFMHAAEQDEELLNQDRSYNDDLNLNAGYPNRFEEGRLDEQDQDEEDGADGEGQEGADEPARKSKNKKKDIIAFADLNNVKNKFESIANDTGEVPSTPKPLRSITPPPDGSARTEIENEPMQRPANVVSVYEKMEDAMPAAGYTRSRKEIFASASSPSQDADQNRQAPRVKSITPPRDEALKRVLKEQTPERNENVVRESDRIDDVLPNAGAIKQTAAMFTNSSARLKSIERSGISIEGELAEKGIAKSRLALFNDPNALQSSTVSTTELESEIIKNASGIAKERLNLFKNLEQQQPNVRTSPSRELKKLKEFTPPPQLDHHQQRQYIIIDKENNESGDAVRESSQTREEFMPETGLAKSRMKQYLESTSSQNGGSGANNSNNIENGEGAEDLPKGLAKSLLAKWKSIENVKDKETSPESSARNSANGGGPRQTSPSDSTSEDFLPQSGLAKSLLNKFQNIESSSSSRERRGPRAITPPPPEELERQKQLNDQDETDASNQKPYVDEELAIIGRGHAKSTLAKFESTPLESGLNAQFAEEEVIPAAGNAKNLKNKFLNLEKEAAKVETSSSKMHYVPKKFTSATSPMTPTSTNQQSKPTAAAAANGNGNKSNGHKSATNGGANANGHANSNSNTEKCCVCEKTVYAMEKIEADKKVYHKLCFKCTSCNCTLNEDNFAFEANKPYCPVDYKKVTQVKTPPASPAKQPAAKKDAAAHLEAKPTEQAKSSPKHEPKSPKVEAKQPANKGLEPPKSPAKSAAEPPKSPKVEPKSPKVDPKSSSAKTLEPPKSPSKPATTTTEQASKSPKKTDSAPKSPKVEAKSPVKAK